MGELEIGARVSEYDQEAIPLDNRSGGPAWKGARVYGTIVEVKEKKVLINWDETSYWALGTLEHDISEIGKNIRIENTATEVA